MSGPQYHAPQGSQRTNLYGQTAGQPYPQYQPDYSSSGLYSERPERRSSALGIIAFVLVAVSGLLFVLAWWYLGDHYMSVYQQVGVPGMDSDDLVETPEFQAAANKMVPWFVTMSVTFFTGIAGWIISIIALSTRRGVGWAVAALLLGIAAPILGMTLFGAQIWSTVS